ncbi:hypothetical protein KK083_25595 [Fulvivirgaceae bacterium PWU4]|uniref:Uncharacterized protein n=1 Tax=Chryseosolibacter histidini TaxID=2782349 RepID=A0AAP2DSL9_9BACT|nr:hypothetical protein [Chryseosolibacter histidini]MBT1700287.1 hypothetical protein [Chryseosolibacter histidini]
MKALDRAIFIGLIFAGVAIFGNFDNSLLDFLVKASAFLIPIGLLNTDWKECSVGTQGHKP